MPELLCGAIFDFHNVYPLETGTSGILENLCGPFPCDSLPRAGTNTTYHASPEETIPCARRADGMGVSAVITGGTWHVLQGGAEGDWVTVEARDVTFERILGHTLRFDRMRWHVLLE